MRKALLAFGYTTILLWMLLIHDCDHMIICNTSESKLRTNLEKLARVPLLGANVAKSIMLVWHRMLDQLHFNS